MSVNGVDRAILFLNLGGPETLKDVKPFLYRLFADPEIIRIPFTPFRKFVAWSISNSRYKKSQKLYKQLGGGSPIKRLTDDQSRAVEEQLNEQGYRTAVRTAFSCSEPLIEDVVKELYSKGIKKFLSFPLYPQYSYTTSKSSLDQVRSAIKKHAPQAILDEIVSYPTHPLFLRAHAEQILKAVVKFSDFNQEDIHLIFSAHSIPEKLVTRLGDPYKREMEETVEGVVKMAHWRGPYYLTWQSKLGPVKWLAPATVDMVKTLGDKGVEKILVVPIAFVTDHIETLMEIDVEMKEVADEYGVKEFHRTPGLNNHPTFIKALVDLAKSKMEFWY